MNFSHFTPRPPQTPNPATTRLYEHIDFLQDIVAKQQRTTDLMQSRIDSLVNHLLEQQQSYTEMFKQQQTMQQKQQQEFHQQQLIKEQQAIREQELKEK